MSSRIKLITKVASLVVAALALIGVLSVLLVRGHLIADADEQLAVLAGIDEVPIGSAEVFPLPSDFVIQLRGPDGGLRREIRSRANGPDIPADARVLAGPVTVGSWRVLADAPQPDGDFLVLAMDLSDVEQTVRLLVLVEAVIGGCVLLGLVVVGVNAVLRRMETAFTAKQRSEERMRRFIADASHELRTPISVIRAHAEYARRDPQDLAATLGRVESEAIRMGALVEDLLSLARLDQRLGAARRPVDLLALAGEAVATCKVMAPDRDVRLVIADAAFLVLGDESGLRQVIGNLLGNAWTHTPAGTPIEVRLRVEDASAVLEVTDHGPGLAPGQAERVFDRFYRVDDGRARDTGGSGLGLAIVAAQVAAHGGTVGVSTAPDAGATFRVTLPLVPEATAA
jgi:two-component system OmpR family sensor kinase